MQMFFLLEQITNFLRVPLYATTLNGTPVESSQHQQRDGNMNQTSWPWETGSEGHEERERGERRGRKGGGGGKVEKEKIQLYSSATERNHIGLELVQAWIAGLPASCVYAEVK